MDGWKTDTLREKSCDVEMWVSGTFQVRPCSAKKYIDNLDDPVLWGSSSGDLKGHRTHLIVFDWYALNYTDEWF